MIEDVNCGFTVSPINEDFLVEKLIFLADNNNECKEIGKRGYLYAKDNFNKNKLFLQIINNLSNLI